MFATLGVDIAIVVGFVFALSLKCLLGRLWLYLADGAELVDFVATSLRNSQLSVHEIDNLQRHTILAQVDAVERRGGIDGLYKFANSLTQRHT